MTWTCAAITNGLTIYSDGTIAPCCIIDNSYRKSVDQIPHDPFADINTGLPPDVCSRCHQSEQSGRPSYRQSFNSRRIESYGLQFLDVRNSNLCNARCRTCGPYNSSQWAQELEHTVPIVKNDFWPYVDHIITPSLRYVYYTGGEPLINGEHWQFLETLIEQGISKNVSLQYNSNLGTLKYKDKDLVEIWSHFKTVDIIASIDAVGNKFNYLRSGLDWETVDQNLSRLIDTPYVKVTIGTTVSILNLWFISELLDYYQHRCRVQLTELFFPDYLSLTSIPDELKDQALHCLDDIESRYNDKNQIEFYRQQVRQNHTQNLFIETLNHVLFLDRQRKENLFDYLPFADIARQRIFYE